MRDIGDKVEYGPDKAFASQGGSSLTVIRPDATPTGSDVSEAECDFRALDVDLPQVRPDNVVADGPSRVRKGFRIADRLIPGFVGAFDVLAIVGSCTVWYAGYVGQEYALANYYFVATICMTVVSVLLLSRMGLYGFETIAAWPHRIGRVLLATVLAVLVLAGLAFLLKISDYFSRFWAIGSYSTAIALIVIIRGGVGTFIARMAAKGRIQRNVVLFGVGPQTVELIERLGQHEAPWINVVGLFDDRTERGPNSVGDLSVLGDFDDLIAEIRRGNVDCVVITLPWYAVERLLSIIDRLKELPVDVCLGADLIGYHFPLRRQHFANGVEVMGIADLPLAGWGGVAKSLVDKVLANVAGILLAPVLLIIALAIRLESRGPILFRQARYGFNNEVIDVYKFRTMYEGRRPEPGAPQAKRNDPRVTKVGRVLRRTSLDELPQLINVLQGTMAIVGPRPHAVEHNLIYERLIPGYYSRHRVKPGITGLAQVSGHRGETATVDQMRARIDCDCHYIESWSLWLDIKIIFLTMAVLIRGTNAY